MSDYMRRLRARVGNALLEIPSVAVAVRDAEGRVLLARSSDDPRWLLPGGQMEPLETPADTAVREIFEETGLLVELVRLFGVYAGPDFHVYYPGGDEVAFVASAFEARIAGGEAVPDGDEILELGWFTPEAWAALDTPAWVPPMLRDLLAGGPGAAFQAPTWRPPPAPRYT